MTRRFPFKPLEAHIEARYEPHPNTSTISIIGKAHQVLGFNRDIIRRWTINGLREDAADRAATALGCHPAEIWPEWFDDAQPDTRDIVLLKPDKRSLLPQPPYKPCGTNAAAKRHRRNGEPLCDACRRAEREYTLPYLRAHQAKKRRAS